MKAVFCLAWDTFTLLGNKGKTMVRYLKRKQSIGKGD